MPGPVSDSYDPEFSTSANKERIWDAIEGVRDIISDTLPKKLKEISSVVDGGNGRIVNIPLTEKQRRILRFALNRVLEE